MPRHALLISENPASAAPRRVVTGVDGTVDDHAAARATTPSNRIVRWHWAARPTQWTQVVDVAAGRETNLKLTAANAEVGAVVASDAGASAAPEADPSFLLPQWQDSVFAIWTAKTHASGFLVDRERARGDEPARHRQRDIRGSAVDAGAEGDGAPWSPPTRFATSQSCGLIRPSPPRSNQFRSACGQSGPDAVAKGQDIVTIGTPLRQEKGMVVGTVSGVTDRRIESDLVLPTGSAGGPVFSAGGTLVGVTSRDLDSGDRLESDARIIRTGQILRGPRRGRQAPRGDSGAPPARICRSNPRGPFQSTRSRTPSRAGPAASTRIRWPPPTSMSPSSRRC